MNPFLAAILAVLSLAAPAAFFGWLRTWKPAHFRRLLARGALLVDVGNPQEYAAGHLHGAVNVPSEELALRQAELGEHWRPIVTYARSHLRSAQAAQLLRGIGFHNVFNVGTMKGVKTWTGGAALCADGTMATQ
jgi:rhodanese-related sulfurtransferase